MKAYLLRVLVQLDILVMAVLNGKRNETLSACAWELEGDGKFFGFWRPVIDWLFSPLQSNHCAECRAAEQWRKLL
jgi:hypothetical protein